MEDQGKRLLLAVAIAFALMLGWSYLFPPEEGPKQADQQEQAEGEGTASRDSVPAPDGEVDETGAAAGAAEPAEPAEPRQPEETFSFEFEKFRAVFSTYGASLKSWELLGERYRQDGEPMDLVKTGEMPSTRPFRVAFENSTHELPADATWKVTRQTDTEIDFVWTSDTLRVTKHYVIHPEDYLLELTVEVEKLSGDPAKQALAIELYGYQDPDADTGGGLARIDRSWKSACLVDEELVTRTSEDLLGTSTERTGDIEWAGFLHSYFLAAAAPETDATRLSCTASAVEGERGVMRMTIEYPFITLGEGDPAYSQTVTAYLGPKYLTKLDAISRIVGHETGFEEAVDLGFLAIIARPLLWLLIWFQGIVVNWGVAIVMLTLTVKLATLYWTQKSMKSMREMSKLRPEIEKLQKEHKDDRQRLQQEMMNLYKAHGVNPLSGCLPMLLQMPIWFALYRTLTVAGELYQAPLVPGWIDDLTAPDPLYILPILLTGMMFLQSKFTPSTADSTQQKIMMYGMPLMFGGFSFFFPAGLTLYIFTSTGLTALHHLVLRRTDKGKPEDKGPPPKKDKPAKDKPPSPSASEGAAAKQPKKQQPAAEDGSSKTGGQPANRPRKKSGKKKSTKRKR